MKFSLVESRLFGSICYGYKRDKHGLVEVVPEQAEVVRTVSASTKPETAWKLFKAVFDLSPSGKAQLSRDELKSS